MQFSAEERKAMSFPWGGLFLATGICGLAFSSFLKLMEGEHSPFLITGGFICLITWVVRFLWALKRR